MTDYYDIFKGLEDRTDDVIAYICAGMYVSGKYSLMNKDKETAKNTFEKIGISCAGATRFLRAMVTEFHLYNLHSEAQKLLVRFPTESMEGEDFLVSSYLANSKDSENPLNITNGINLVNKGIKDFNSMMVLIDTLCKEDKWEKAEDYLMDVKKWWPELKGKAKLPNKPESIEKNKTANRNIEGEDASVANSTPKDIPA